MTTTSQASPFSADSHITAASKLSPAESKLLTGVKSELDRVNKISDRCRAVNMGQSHPLDELIHKATLELMETATAEAAEKVHSLMIRKRDAEISSAAISASLQTVGRREIEKLTPLAIRILNDAEAAFVAEADQHRAATKTATTFASSVAEFEARVESTRAALAEKRRWVSEEGASAHYLMIELGLTP